MKRNLTKNPGNKETAKIEHKQQYLTFNLNADNKQLNPRAPWCFAGHPSVSPKLPQQHTTAPSLPQQSRFLPRSPWSKPPLTPFLPFAERCLSSTVPAPSWCLSYRTAGNETVRLFLLKERQRELSRAHCGAARLNLDSPSAGPGSRLSRRGSALTPRYLSV